MLFNSLSLNEHVSKARIKNLASANTDIVPLDEKKKIEKYTKVFQGKDVYKVEYQRPELKCFGRITPKPHTGLGVFCREIRGYLANGVYIDVDMVNCHPVILRATFEKYSLDSSIIGDYVDNREEFLAREGIDKTAFLLMINKEDFSGGEDGTGAVKKLHSQIYKTLLPILKQEYKHIKTERSKDKYNPGGKFIAILSQLYLYGQENGLNIDVLMHDGFFVRIVKGEVDADFVNQNFIDNERLTNMVREKFGINMKFKVKEHDLSLVDKLQTISTTTPSYEMMKKEFENTHCKIVKKSFFMEEDQSSLSRNLQVYSEQKLCISYKHLRCVLVDDDGKETQMPFIPKWLTDPDIRLYKDIGVFPNEESCPDDIFNMWTKFDMEYVDAYTEDLDSLELVLSHVKVLCGNDEEVFKYFCKWIGQMFKHPTVKTVCPTLISKQGAGKGFLLTLLRKMLGEEKVFESTTPSRDVWGHFNTKMSSTFLVNLNELSKKETFDAEGKIKGLITDSSMVINDKGVPTYTVTSYHRFIITTNNYDPINTSKDDRRNLIIRSSDEKIGDKSYFNSLFQILDDTNALKTCYEYFKGLPDLEKFNSLPLPKTKFHEEIIEASESPIEHWIREVALESPADIANYTANEALNEFLAHCDKHKFKFTTNSAQLARKINSLEIPGVGTRRTKSANIRTFDCAQILKHYGVEKEEVFKLSRSVKEDED